MRFVHNDDFPSLEKLKYYFEVDKKSGELFLIRDFQNGRTYHNRQVMPIETDLCGEKVIAIVDSEGNERKYSAAKIIFALTYQKEVSDKQKVYYKNQDSRTISPSNIVVRNW
jgi:hypothetical protein